MADKAKISIQLKVQDDSNLKAPIFVNQFRVLKEDSLIKLFVSFNSSGQNLFSGLFIINEQTLGFNKSDTVKYYERITNVFANMTPATETQFAIGSPQLFYGNFIESSHYGELAQLRLIYISLSHLVAASQPTTQSRGTTVPAVASCILNLPITVQMGIIRKVYMDA